MKKLPSPLEEELAMQIKACELPEPIREYRFAPPRRFRADFAWPEHRLIVELEGGIYKRGWHQSIQRMLSDMTKYNLMTLTGWRLLRFAGQHVRDLTAITTIEKALGLDQPKYGVKLS